MKTYLYCDGFNLCYSALKGTPSRWLNPVELPSRGFPRNQIVASKLFTAPVMLLSQFPGNLTVSRPPGLLSASGPHS
jgi:hypothetical protein